jgi:uncharacterized protein (TIGR02145 family)
MFLSPKIILPLIHYGSIFAHIVRSIIAIFLLSAFSLGFGQVKKDSMAVTGLKDSVLIDTRDGHHYKTVKIGDQIWMAENLNYKTDDSWYYDDNEENGKKYGRLYTWHAALKACPTGWHLPADDEWTALVNAVGGADIGGTAIKQGGSSGFQALLSGYRYSGGSCYYMGSFANYWSSSRDGLWYAWYRFIDSSTTAIYRNGTTKAFGFCVRCVKD